MSKKTKYLINKLHQHKLSKFQTLRNRLQFHEELHTVNESCRPCNYTLRYASLILVEVAITSLRRSHKQIHLSIKKINEFIKSNKTSNHREQVWENSEEIVTIAFFWILMSLALKDAKARGQEHILLISDSKF